MISYLSYGLHRWFIFGWSEMHEQDKKMVVCSRSTSISKIAWQHPSRGPLFEVYSVTGAQSICITLVPILLVARVEERRHRHCVAISCLLTCQDQAIDTKRFIAVFATTRVEVGLHYMQFNYISTPFQTLDGCHIGYSRYVDKIGAHYADSYNLSSIDVG